MRTTSLLALFAGVASCTPMSSVAQDQAFTIFPKNGAVNVNPDTQLVLTFSSPPKIGTSGLIRVFDAATNKVVDTLDLKIPSSPNPSGRAPNGQVPKVTNPNDKREYQVNKIAGFDFHFFPIIVRENTATITLHNGALKYGKKYTIKVDAAVLQAADGKFEGLTTGGAWSFSTKAAPPDAEASKIVVALDGTGDFSTVQGAVDYLPEKSAKHRTVFIKNGDYEEIVFVRSKSNIIFRGESRDKVKVGYPNNSAFNPPKGGPSRRVPFTLYKCKDVQLSSFTINNYFIGQAEALLVDGERVIVDHMTLNGSGDSFTTYGSIYFVDSKLTGHGDSVLGYGAVFFLRSEIQSIGPITWTRTVAGSHGNVFVNSTIIGVDKPLPWTVGPDGKGGKVPNAVFARLPNNGKPGSTAANFPYAEMVLINTKTSGIPAVGWGPIESGPGFDSSKVHFWEYNTMDMKGMPVDMSKRHPVSKQLNMQKDAKTIADYSTPEFVLKGWIPVVEKS